MRTCSIYVAALALFGCGPELGPCDLDAARRVVYDEDGAPAFEGQALMIRSCGGGGFCHSADIPSENRRGAPAGLEYDVRLASYGPGAEPEETERLRTMQGRAFAHRHAIWAQVEAGRMPIPGDASVEVMGAASVYQRFDPVTGARAPFAGLDTAAGREVFRNWLACGLPVVERTQPVTEGQASEPLGLVVSSQEVEPLEDSWSDIYARLVDRRCNSQPCHGESREGDLYLVGEAESLARLAESSAAGDECSTERTPLLIPFDPEGSLFYQKLSGRDASGATVCGRVMPIGRARVSGPSLDAIRAWIAKGAPP